MLKINVPLNMYQGREHTRFRLCVGLSKDGTWLLKLDKVKSFGNAHVPIWSKREHQLTLEGVRAHYRDFHLLFSETIPFF